MNKPKIYKRSGVWLVDYCFCDLTLDHKASNYVYRLNNDWLGLGG